MTADPLSHIAPALQRTVAAAVSDLVVDRGKVAPHAGTGESPDSIDARLQTQLTLAVLDEERRTGAIAREL
jgi:hypothetical protein